MRADQSVRFTVLAVVALLSAALLTASWINLFFATSEGDRQRSLIYMAVAMVGVGIVAVAALLDAHARTKQVQTLSEQRYETLVENLSDVVFTIRPDGTLEFVSPAVVDMFGIEATEATGKTLERLLGERAADQVQRRIERGLPEKGTHLAIDGCATPEGPIDVDVVLTPGPSDASIQGILRDVTALRRHQNELLHMASHDFLTGLWNRRRFEEELARALSNLARGGESGAVLWLDLDGFKDVNDALGHRVGDELLVRISQRLAGTVRVGSSVARLGGDEFGVLMPSADADAALAVAERLLKAIADVRLNVDGRLVRTSGSLGIVLYPDHGTELDDLLVRADVAMYRAKDLGRSRAVVFDPGVLGEAGVEDRGAWTDIVEMAIEEDGLVAFAQPIRDLATGQTVSFELLVRMEDFDGAVISPDRFLPVAERTGMIVDIDRWIVRQAFSILERHADAPFRLNVNASPRTLSDPRYLDALEALVTASPVDPSRLTIEVTETAVIVDVAGIIDTLRRIRSLGCRIALDDFGSGFTSFLHLKQLPVDDIKIDGTFIRHVTDSVDDQHLVRAMVEMARGLKLRTTAEFVESEEAADLIRSFGVELAQGYAIGRPTHSDTVVWPT
jgi:diguanylate cyclase (GGDEF)-like protein/PAS domain S-box-containing protein